MTGEPYPVVKADRRAHEDPDEDRFFYCQGCGRAVNVPDDARTLPPVAQQLCRACKDQCAYQWADAV